MQSDNAVNPMDDDDDDIPFDGWEEPKLIVDELDDASADKILARYMKIEIELNGIETEQAAINENMERRKKEKRDKLEWLHGMYDAMLETHARKQRAGSKKKFYTLPHGTIQWRNAPGSTKITNMEKAVEWLKANGYDYAVKIAASTSTEALKEALEAFRKANPDFVPSFIDTTPAGENVTTGAGIIKWPAKRSTIRPVILGNTPARESLPTPISDVLPEIMESIVASNGHAIDDDDDTGLF